MTGLMNVNFFMDGIVLLVSLHLAHCCRWIMDDEIMTH